MTKQIQDYLNLITSEHRSQPNFTAMISFCVATQVQVQTLLDSMQAIGGIFDLDTPPVGNQLDIIGEFVGVSRNLEVPVEGVFFSWDDVSADGWEFGIWKDPINDQVLTVLPDDVYLTLIRAKIAANRWDGTTEGAYNIWAVLFPTLHLLIQDNTDMSFVVALQGMPLDSLTLVLLTSGILPLRPEGILISEYIVSVDTNPLFGWDIQNSYIQGWNNGSWGQEHAPT